MPQARKASDDAALFGAIVNRMRLDRHWTLEEFARRTGMNATYLGVLERGGNLPTLGTILRLAEVFGVEAASLVAEVEAGRRKMRARATAAAKKRPAPKRTAGT
jgi:transcriptional regulator with XRE-family HTH domain